MKRLVAAAVLVAGLFASIVGTLRAEVTAEQVRKAIDRGVNYLKAQQRADGSWTDIGRAARRRHRAVHPGPVELPASSRATSSMQKGARLSPQDPAREDLRRLAADDGLRPGRAGKRPAADPPQREVAGEDADHRRAGTTGPGPIPAWAATATTPTPSSPCWPCTRPSASACRPATQTWRLAKTYWENCQNADGSWGYNRQSANGTGSMTCAGITSLVIAADRVQPSDARVVGDRIECCVPHDAGDADRIERGHAMAGASIIPSTHNPGAGGSLAALLSLRPGARRPAHRAAVHSAAYPTRPARPGRLVSRRGRLSGPQSGQPVGLLDGRRRRRERIRVIGTSFALLFLSKGRWPVLMGKLQHGPGDDWNQHRNDVANLTRYVERNGNAT